MNNVDRTLFFSVGESGNEKCKSQKTAVLDGTPFENWSYYRLRMTKWVNILIKWQDLIKTWESVLRVSHTERQRILRTSDTDYSAHWLITPLSSSEITSDTDPRSWFHHFPLARKITHFCLPALPAFQAGFHINNLNTSIDPSCRKWPWS